MTIASTGEPKVIQFLNRLIRPLCPFWDGDPWPFSDFQLRKQKVMARNHLEHKLSSWRKIARHSDQQTLGMDGFVGVVSSSSTGGSLQEQCLSFFTSVTVLRKTRGQSKSSSLKKKWFSSRPPLNFIIAYGNLRWLLGTPQCFYDLLYKGS